MADWLILLLKYGGFGAVLVVALFVMGKWLLKRITAALDSYTTAYLQQKAAIDARIASLEKSVEERARLTRTVESIKDEIAAEAKSRDNRWEFRRDIYSALIRITVEIMAIHTKQLGLAQGLATNEDRVKLAWALDAELAVKGREFWALACLAPLATAERILPLVRNANDQLFKVIDNTQDVEPQIRARLSALATFLAAIQDCGRKDLWGTPENEAEAEKA